MYLLFYFKVFFNSILSFATLSVFNVRNVIIRGGGFDQFTASEKFAPPPEYSEPWPPNILNLPTPMVKTQNSHAFSKISS